MDAELSDIDKELVEFFGKLDQYFQDGDNLVAKVQVDGENGVLLTKNEHNIIRALAGEATLGTLLGVIQQCCEHVTGPDVAPEPTAEELISFNERLIDAEVRKIDSDDEAGIDIDGNKLPEGRFLPVGSYSVDDEFTYLDDEVGAVFPTDKELPAIRLVMASKVVQINKPKNIGMDALDGNYSTS